MSINYTHYVKWIHMLAWRTLDISDLSTDDRKLIGVFIGNVKNKKYISEKNTLLIKVAKIVDTHLNVKSTAQPTVKDKYSKAEEKEIRKGIRELHKIGNEESPVWQFCNRFLFSASGKRRTKKLSANRYWHAKMTLEINANQNLPIPYATTKQRSSNG